MKLHYDDASKLWCPMSRVSDEEIGMNRYWDGMDSDGKPGPGGVFCIGVKCMAWRWSDKNAALGYCGLAGRPE